MGRFVYTAMDGRGKEKKGRIEAQNEQDAQMKLKEQGLFPTSIAEAKGKKGGGKTKAAKKSGGAKKGKSMFAGGQINLFKPALKQKDLTLFTRQLSTLLEAGLPLVRGLRTLEKQAGKNPVLKDILGEICASVEGGSTFSESLKAHKKSFTKLYVNMIHAGEASGALDEVLTRLAEFMEKSARLKGKIKAALTYPVAVLCIAGVITSGLMIFIVPKFAKIFNDMLAGEPLPGLTQFVMSISDFMKNQYLILFGGIFAFVVTFKMIKKTKSGSFAFDFILIKTPPFSGLVVKASVATFARTLSTLMNAGVSILEALQIVSNTSGNQVVADAVMVVHDAVKEGEGLAEPLESTKVFPGMVVSMVEVGEETGALPEMLARIADTYEEEVDNAVDGMVALIEPAMIVFLAIIVGGIVIALFLPLIKLVEQLGG
ncbi:MAG: type II secretion system F family protein [Verrucomicrobiota bacterium]|nr:type II secretion system F family protein [Verrucomicrobiota bacterium]